MGFDECFELTKYKLKSPIKEPEIPNSDVCALPEPLVHPDSAHVSLIYIPQTSYLIHYAPTISCVLSMSSNSEIRTPARALINTSASISIVSPQIVTKLQITPTVLDVPILVTQKYNGPFQLSTFVVLDVISLYKPSYRYRRIFYVADCSFYKVTPPTTNVKKYTLAYNIQLSSELINDDSMSLDLLIGWDQFSLTGLELVGVSLSPKDDLNVVAYYTHFGYTLCGIEKCKHEIS